MKEKPELNFWQIWNMSFGFMGIQFGWGLQMANMSPIYRYLGAKPDELPILWLAAPMTGLLIQPIIGYWSDRTWTPLGRRKPYFLVGAILSTLALIAMPNCSTLWMAAGLLWILDASINVSMEPFRAFVADLLPKKQYTRGYTMQSFFIGVGAVIASALPWLMSKFLDLKDVEDNAIPLSVKYSFYIGAIAFISAVLYTIIKTKEYPPDGEKLSQESAKGEIGFIQSALNGIKEIWNHIFNMPSVMNKIALVQFFTWLGLFLMWFYFGDAVATYVFHAPSPSSELYKEGAEWSGLMFSFYSLVTMLFALVLGRLADKFGKINMHSICLIAGAVGLISLSVIDHKFGLIFCMLGVGIAWTSILSMPYAIFAPHLPENKVGVYMGIFNFFIVIPEIMATLFFGFVMKNFLQNNSMYAVILGGCMLFIAALLCLRIKEN